jgi:hypothetical protein
MAAIINAFWIVVSTILLVAIGVLVMIGLCLSEREMQKERERCEETAHEQAEKTVCIELPKPKEPDWGGYTERELSEITQRLLQEESQRPRRYFGRVCYKGYGAGFAGYKPRRKRRAYWIIGRYLKCGRVAA